MSSLKQKTVSGLLWSFIDNMAQKGITFIVGIILARLLLPAEFGLIGMITIFIAISTSFMESGFGAALIRKQDCTDADFSTVFYFNLTVGVFFYVLLFFLAPAISRFFNEPLLVSLVQVLSIVIVIDSLTIIQRTILTKRIDFKLQTKISVISSVISGVIGVAMAYQGFGVWSLVAKTLSQRGVNSLLLWLWNRWKPMLVFSKQSFMELFSFGNKLLLSGLINTIFQNVYYLVIGKYFSAQELGYYTRADQFRALPSQNLMSIVSRVSYPVLAQMQDDKIALKLNYKKMIKSSMLLSFILLLGMAAVAEPMVISLIGEKWRPSIIYLQMLCFVAMLYPLHSLNLNMLLVLGRSDLGLKLEIIKKILVIPMIIIGIFWGIKMMIAGMIVNSFIAYYLNSYWSGKFINYPMKEQVYDILPSFFLATLSSVIVYAIGYFLPFGYLSKLLIQLFSGAVLIFALCEVTKIDSYLFVKEIVLDKLKTVKREKS